MTKLRFTTSISQVALRSIAAALGLAAVGVMTPAALAQLTPSESTLAESAAANVGSEALTTRPVQVSLSDLVDFQSDHIRVEDRPTLVFSLGEPVTTSREQIQENKPENSNVIHFPLEN